MAADNLSDRNRFHKSYAVSESGCWHWKLCVTHDGYPLFGVGSRKVGTFKLCYAHRWAFEQFVGFVPVGLELDHKCRNRNCVNPQHLEPVTHTENVNRGRHANRERMHCIAGHPLRDENLYISPVGKRVCIICRRRRSSEFGKRNAWHHQKAYRNRKRKMADD